MDTDQSENSRSEPPGCVQGEHARLRYLPVSESVKSDDPIAVGPLMYEQEIEGFVIATTGDAVGVMVVDPLTIEPGQVVEVDCHGVVREGCVSRLEIAKDGLWHINIVWHSAGSP